MPPAPRAMKSVTVATADARKVRPVALARRSMRPLDVPSSPSSSHGLAGASTARNAPSPRHRALHQPASKVLQPATTVAPLHAKQRWPVELHPTCYYHRYVCDNLNGHHDHNANINDNHLAVLACRLRPRC